MSIASVARKSGFHQMFTTIYPNFYTNVCLKFLILVHLKRVVKMSMCCFLQVTVKLHAEEMSGIT